MLYYSIVSHAFVRPAGNPPAGAGAALCAPEAGLARNTLGEFEQQVLLAILRLEGEAYSVSIVAELEDKTDREIATAAVYVALRRLEKKGLLTSRLESPGKSGSPYPRRYFALTDAAYEPLRAARRAMLGLWDGLEPVLDD